MFLGMARVPYVCIRTLLPAWKSEHAGLWETCVFPPHTEVMGNIEILTPLSNLVADGHQHRHGQPHDASVTRERHERFDRNAFAGAETIVPRLKSIVNVGQKAKLSAVKTGPD